MALTVDEVSIITTDVILDRPLRVDGPEAKAMAKEIKADIEAMRKDGFVPMPIREVPEPDAGEAV